MTAYPQWTYTIHIRDTWDAEWVEVTAHNLLCLRVARNCLGAIESAAFRYATGFISQDGKDETVVPNVFPYTGKWVKVTPNAGGGKPWVGYILAPDEIPFAASDIAGTLTVMGCDFDFIAVCPKYFLDRNQIITTVYYDHDGDSPVPKRTKRPIGFNMGIGGDDRDVASSARGNKDSRAVPLATYGVGEYPVFCSDPAEREQWNAEDVVQYLLAWQSLRDQDDTPAPFPIRIHSLVFPSTSLADFIPILPTEGRSALSLINSVLNPANGYVWWLEYDADDDLFELLASTVVGAEVPLTSGAVLQVAANLVTLDFDTDRSVAGRPKVGNSQNKRYHRVRVRGARRTATFSLGTGQLVNHWENSVEDEYKAADGKTDAKEADEFRKADRFAAVYTRYRLKADWDGKSYDGTLFEWVDSREYSCPELVPGSEAILGPAPLNIPGMRFRNTTLLHEGFDYTDATSPVDNDPASTTPELMRPLAYAYHAGKYYALDKAAGQGDPPLKHSYHLHILKGVPGIELRPHNGVNHLLAKTYFDTDNSGTSPSRVNPEIDPDCIGVTVTAEWDAYCEGTYPEGDVFDVPLQELVVDIGERARWDYLAVGTVFDVNGGADPKRVETGGSLRDDRNMCRQLAKSIYQWFAEDRQTIEVLYNRIVAPVWVGDFINTFGTQDTIRTANCTVTQLLYNFENGTTTVLGGIEDIEFPGGLS